MKKSLLVSVFAALAMMVSVNSFAQEKATKEDYKEIAKQEKAKQKEYLEHLFVKRKEIETNLLLIQDYINKATL